MDPTSRALRVVQEFRKLDPEMPAQVMEAFLWIALGDGKRQSDLEALADASKSSAQRWFLTLSDKGRAGRPGLGLIEVRVGESDARERRAFLTAKGRRFLAKLSAVLAST